MYKLIAIDLDGTLLNSYGDVSDENKKAIENAKNRGIEVVLTSGRMSASVMSIAEEVGADNYMISGNGALIYDLKNKKILYNQCIPKDKVLKIVKICEENSIYYTINTEKYILSKTLNYNLMYYYYENIRIIILVCELIFLILILSFIYYIYTLYKEKINIKNELYNKLNDILTSHKIATFCTIIIGLISIIDITLKISNTNHNIGSFYEEDNYIDNFYVFVSRTPFDKEKSYIKKVPATIHSVRGGLENNSYYIKSMTINNQEIQIEPSEEIYLNGDTKVYDVEDNIYYIQLTNDKVIN